MQELWIDQAQVEVSLPIVIKKKEKEYFAAKKTAELAKQRKLKKQESEKEFETPEAKRTRSPSRKETNIHDSGSASSGGVGRGGVPPPATHADISQPGSAKKRVARTWLQDEKRKNNKKKKALEA